MSKTIYYSALSVDGYIADANHTLDWLFQFGDINDTSYPEFIKTVGALAMGSTTYEWVIDHISNPDGSLKEPWPYQQPTWVFSKRELKSVLGADIRFVTGPVEPFHAEMRKTSGLQNIWIVGGGQLAGHFFDAGLIDELILQIAPVLLTTGAPLLPRAITKPPMRLLNCRRYADFIEAHYEVPKSPQDSKSQHA